MKIITTNIPDRFVGPRIFVSLGQHIGQPWLSISDGRTQLTANFDDLAEFKDWLDEAITNLKASSPMRAIVL